VATQLTLVNNILRRLRENEVASVSNNAYSKLIAQFLNDAKADLEDINYEWSVYVSEQDVTILADGTRTYDITDTNDRSWLMRDSNDDRLPLAYDITTDEVGQLFDCSYKDLKRQRALTASDDAVEVPKVFASIADTDGRGWTLELLWGGNEARSWRTYWYIPQDDLALDGSDDNTEYLLPSRPIEQRAYFYALNERGEEMGEPGGIALKRAKDSLAAALEVHMQVQKKSDEIDIKRNETL
jgi:hypothetical protein